MSHKTTTLKVKNFQALLPEDLVQIICIGDYHKKELFVDRGWVVPNLGFNYKVRSYFIRENKIFFAGQYSQNKIIKFFQELWEQIFPKKIVLTYLKQ